MVCVGAEFIHNYYIIIVFVDCGSFKVIQNAFFLSDFPLCGGILHPS